MCSSILSFILENNNREKQDLFSSWDTLKNVTKSVRTNFGWIWNILGILYRKEDDQMMQEGGVYNSPYVIFRANLFLNW